MSADPLRFLDRLLRQQHHPLWEEYRLLKAIRRHGLQDVRLVYLRRLGIRTAQECLGPKGEFLVDRAESLIARWEEWAPSWPNLTRGLDPYLAQARDCLARLAGDSSLRVLLMSCSKPSHQLEAESRILFSVGPFEKGPVTDRTVRVAVLSAFLTPLRQTVGSCFATAPAILIQREDPTTFLDDLRQLLDTGRLERTTFGETSAVPMALRWASGLVLRPIPITSALDRDLSLLVAAQAAGLLQPGALHVQRAAWKKLLKPFLDQKIHLQDLFSQLIAQHLGIEWPLAPLESLTSGDLVLPPGVARQLRLQETFQQRLDMALQAFAGIEHHPLLKTWEYTLASFTEARPLVTAHNLWNALGLASQDPDSLGGHLREQLQGELDRLQEEQERFAQMTDAARARHTSARSQAGHARSEYDVQRVQAEARSAQRDYDYASGNLAQLQEHAEALAELPQRFGQEVERLMPRYFQEAYDPALLGQTESIYDDAPAGFRLIFKGGVEAVRAWSWVYSPSQYLQAMREFLDRVFVELRDTPDSRMLGRNLLDVSHSTSLFLDQPAFLEGSLKRLAAAHGRELPSDPLHHLDQCTYKPWAYESGGTLLGLVKHYFALPEMPTFEEKRVERPADLLSFYIDTLRALPDHLLKSLAAPYAGLLAFSPTHAFLLNTGASDLARCVESSTYSYTFVAEQWMSPAEIFYQGCQLTPGDALDQLLESWIMQLPPALQGAARLAALGLREPVSPRELYALLEQALDAQLKRYDLTPRILTPLDALLASRLPLLTQEQALTRLSALFPEINLTRDPPLVDLSAAHQRLDWIHTKSFLNGTPMRRLEICRRLRAGGLLAPAPLIWGDTNWPFYAFALAMSPGRGVPDLWRVEAEGIGGVPMTEWHEYLTEGNEQPWGILNRPQEYRHRIASARALGPRQHLLS